jgi:hypothetical protein
MRVGIAVNGGKRIWLVLLIVALASGLTGGAIGLRRGFYAGSTAGERNQYNLALRDAREMLAGLRRAEPVLRRVRERLGHMDDGSVAIDKAGIDAVTSTPQPITAELFQARRYLAYTPETVDRLFAYFAETEYTWLEFAHLAESCKSGAVGDASTSQTIRRLRMQLDVLIQTHTDLTRDLTQVAALRAR